MANRSIEKNPKFEVGQCRIRKFIGDIIEGKPVSDIEGPEQKMSPPTHNEEKVPEIAPNDDSQVDFTEEEIAFLKATYEKQEQCYEVQLERQNQLLKLKNELLEATQMHEEITVQLAAAQAAGAEIECNKQGLKIKFRSKTAAAEAPVNQELKKKWAALQAKDEAISKQELKLKLAMKRAETEEPPALKSIPPPRNITSMGMVDKSGTSCDTSKIYRGYIKPSCCENHFRRHRETFVKLWGMTMLGGHDKEGRQEVIFTDQRAMREHIHALIGHPADKLFMTKLRLAMFLYDPTVRSFLVSFYLKSVMPNVAYRIAATVVEIFVSYVIPNVDNDEVMKELCDLLEEMFEDENFSGAFSTAPVVAPKKTSSSKPKKVFAVQRRRAGR